jgi:hypothetical protein
MVIGSGISRDSGGFKHYTRMSGQGYPECHLKDWPMTSPGAPTDSNLLVHAGGNSTQFLEEFG